MKVVDIEEKICGLLKNYHTIAEQFQVPIQNCRNKINIPKTYNV